MTVAELIEKLKGFDPTATVEVQRPDNSGWGTTIHYEDLTSYDFHYYDKVNILEIGD